MPVRKIVEIDESKCDGCGLCVPACAEGAIRIVDGKAKLISESYCDGLGACLGTCPNDAIRIVEREAAPFDEQAVQAHLKEPQQKVEATGHSSPTMPPSCPGSQLRTFSPAKESARRTATDKAESGSALAQWPVQLRLVPPTAPFLKDAEILLCADCVPFATADFHTRLLPGRALLVGCPKLDDISAHIEKLSQIILTARPRKFIVARMEVPCCRGLLWLLDQAMEKTNVRVPVEEFVISIRGNITGDDKSD